VTAKGALCLPIPVELNRPEILSDVKAAIRLPIAVKMSPYFSSFANMATAGADVTMLCSILMRCGIEQIRVIERQMEEWMEKHVMNRSQGSKGV
jgi:dihydroorotate dehydrogenase